jgi:hypothetical protein
MRGCPTRCAGLWPASCQKAAASSWSRRTTTTLLDLGSYEARHSPLDADGVYRGYPPADAAEGIELLTNEVARGAEYLGLPYTAL